MQPLDLNAILNSWEDEDHNRYFPVGDGRAILRDGGDGKWRGVVVIDDIVAPDFNTSAAE